MPKEDSDTPKNEAGNKLEIIIDEEARKVFEKIRYIFDLKDYKEVLEQGISMLLTYIRLAEQGYHILIPAKKEGNKLMLQSQDGKVNYLKVTAEDIDRLLYWKQMQDAFEGFRKP